MRRPNPIALVALLLAPAAKADEREAVAPKLQPAPAYEVSSLRITNGGSTHRFQPLEPVQVEMTLWNRGGPPVPGKFSVGLMTKKVGSNQVPQLVPFPRDANPPAPSKVVTYSLSFPAWSDAGEYHLRAWYTGAPIEGLAPPSIVAFHVAPRASRLKIVEYKLDIKPRFACSPDPCQSKGQPYCGCAPIVPDTATVQVKNAGNEASNPGTLKVTVHAGCQKGFSVAVPSIDAGQTKSVVGVFPEIPGFNKYYPLYHASCDQYGFEVWFDLSGPEGVEDQKIFKSEGNKWVY